MVLLDDVNYLISNGIGDLSRLEHIKETLQNNKELYDSDRKYFDELSEKYLFSNQKTVDIPKVEPNTIIKEESSHETLKDSSTEIPIETTSQESFCENCGANKGKESNFCSKCGQSDNVSSPNSFCGNCGTVKNQNEPCKICNNKDNSKNNRSKKIGKIILYLLGLIIIFSGMLFFAYSMELPTIFAGQYLTLSLLILVIGGVLIYAGKRIKYN